MKHLFKSHITLIIPMLLMLACGELPELDIEQPDALIVADGWIEEGQRAKVFLTTNAPYFSTIDSSELRDLVLTRAKVTLSDGEKSEVLILRKDFNYFPPFYYEGNEIQGKTGRSYTLAATYGGKSIIAQTTIPESVGIDTTYFETAAGEDSLGVIVIEFTDPPSEKNYYRIFTKVLGEDERFIAAFLVAIDDQYFSGEKILINLSRLPESFLSTEGNDYFHINDTVLVKLATMDEASFNFWSSYQEEVINATNPFASSMQNLESNISGEGLGVWTGYGVHLDTVMYAH